MRSNEIIPCLSFSSEKRLTGWPLLGVSERMRTFPLYEGVTGIAPTLSTHAFLLDLVHVQDGPYEENDRYETDTEIL